MLSGFCAGERKMRHLISTPELQSLWVRSQSWFKLTTAVLNSHPSVFNSPIRIWFDFFWSTVCLIPFDPKKIPNPSRLKKTPLSKIDQHDTEAAFKKPFFSLRCTQQHHTIGNSQAQISCAGGFFFVGFFLVVMYIVLGDRPLYKVLFPKPIFKDLLPRPSRLVLILYEAGRKQAVVAMGRERDFSYIKKNWARQGWIYVGTWNARLVESLSKDI